MRTLALLLLAANAIFFGWANWIDEPTKLTTTFEPQQSDIPSIKLATERPASLTLALNKTPNTAADNATQTNDTKAHPSCISVGPFQDLPTAAQAAATLHGEGFESEQRLQQGELWVGYWLTVADIKSRDAADRAITTLKEHGIADAYVISGSDPPNLVSLGVFKDQERANRLLEAVKKLGLNAQMTNRTRAGSVYWLDVPLTQPDKRFDLSLLGAEPGKILRLELSACH
jgi:hypothetical protein